MSLNRTALRLAAIEALRPFGEFARPVDQRRWPTLALDNIADSLVEPLPASDPRARQPFIGVYTDEGDVERRGQDGLCDASHRAQLACEIIVPQIITVDGQAVAFAADTNAGCEATLDLIECQILEAIGRARMEGPLRHVLISVEKIESRVWRDPDTNIKLSARRFELNCHISETGPVPVGQSGLLRLPAPLAAVAALLPAGSPGLVTCARLAAALADPDAFPALSLLDITASFTRETDSAPADLAGDLHASVTL